MSRGFQALGRSGQLRIEPASTSDGAEFLVLDDRRDQAEDRLVGQGLDRRSQLNPIASRIRRGTCPMTWFELLSATCVALHVTVGPNKLPRTTA